MNTLNKITAEDTAVKENTMAEGKFPMDPLEFQKILANAPKVDLRNAEAIAEPLKPYIPSMECGGNQC
jgi:hypothetical protein